MRYRFNEFVFDSDSLLLTNKGEATAIRHTEAKVLALLLDKTDTVLNKNDILSHVWQDKIVSEQVVFQNINHLRSMFGNDAIKTFPKRGYQWQLNTETITPENHKVPNSPSIHSVVNSSQQSSFSVTTQKQPFLQLAVFTIIIFVIVSAFYFQNELSQKESDRVIKLAYIPMTNLDDKSNPQHKNTIIEDVMLESAMLEDNNDFDFTELTHLNTEQFEDSMAVEYPKLSNMHPYVLTGKIRTHKQKTYIDFRVTGHFSDWPGQLSGSSRKDVIEQMQLHLKQQVIYDFISKPQSLELKQARLSIAHKNSPNDLIILRKLSVFYFKTGELEKAMAMADKLISLAQSQNKSQHVGRALLYQSKILTRKKLYDLSSQKLKLAMVQFEKTNDLKYLAHAWYYQSWLDHQQKNYPAIKASLLKSAQLAYAAKNKVGEIEALIYLGVLAHDYQKDDDKYLYLQQAENKIIAYQLPMYHLAKIFYRYAAFAQALSEKEPHLKQVLKLTTTTPEHWAAQSSRKQLMQNYLMQNRLIDAQALIDTVIVDNANNSYLKALMAQAEQQTNQMISHAQRTFEQAQLAGDNSLSLDAALLLCKHAVNCDFYSQYINENSTAYWRSTNETNLLAPKH